MNFFSSALVFAALTIASPRGIWNGHGTPVATVIKGPSGLIFVKDGIVLVEGPSGKIFVDDGKVKIVGPSGEIIVG